MPTVKRKNKLSRKISLLRKGGYSPKQVKFQNGGNVDDYIYLTHGGTTAGTYDAGKFVLVFEGYIP